MSPKESPGVSASLTSCRNSRNRCGGISTLCDRLRSSMLMPNSPEKSGNSGSLTCGREKVSSPSVPESRKTINAQNLPLRVFSWRIMNAAIAMRR